MRGKDLTIQSQSYAEAGYSNLQNALNSLADKDILGASEWFKNAELAFGELSENTRYLTSQANSLINESLYLDTAGKLIESATTVSQMGQELIAMIENIKNIPQNLLIQDESKKDTSLISLVYSEKTRFEKILGEAVDLQRNLTTLNSRILPAEFQNRIAQAQEKIGTLLAYLMEIKNGFNTALTLLGDKMPHRYLVLFQNNNELRATGGFLGSYMIVDVNDGVITKMDAKDVYETDGRLVDVVTPPPGIDKVADRWFMRDANYSPDFPTSAEKIMWFLEHSGGPSADTVIAIDQGFVEKLLEITGPIRLPDFPFQISSDNFSNLISFYIEAKISDTATPKQLLFDLIPAFRQKLSGLNDISVLSSKLKELAGERHIQVYSKDAEIEALAKRLEIDGTMIAPAPKTDFLAIVTTSIGGNKSDRYIKTDVAHDTEISNMGLVMDHLVITKNHTWKESDFETWKNLSGLYGSGKTDLETLRFIEGAGDNIDYMRVYVPLGSRIIKVDGIDPDKIEITEDLGYTVLNFEFGPVAAGTNKTVSLQYELPFTLSFAPADTYKFVAQKQAGSKNMVLKKSLVTADSLNIIKSYPSSDDPFSLMPLATMDFNTNRIFASSIKSLLK